MCNEVLLPVRYVHCCVLYRGDEPVPARIRTPRTARTANSRLCAGVESVRGQRCHLCPYITRPIRPVRPTHAQHNDHGNPFGRPFGHPDASTVPTRAGAIPVATGGTAATSVHTRSVPRQRLLWAPECPFRTGLVEGWCSPCGGAWRRVSAHSFLGSRLGRFSLNIELRYRPLKLIGPL